MSRAVSLSHSFSPSGGWNGECHRGLGCASVRRSRHRPPLRHTGLAVLPKAAPRPVLKAQAPSAQSVYRGPDFSGPFAEYAFPSPPLRVRPSLQRVACLPDRLAGSRRGQPPAGPIMDADAVSAHPVLVALSAPRSHPPPALPCRATRAGQQQPVGPVRSTPERKCVLLRVRFSLQESLRNRNNE